MSLRDLDRKLYRRKSKSKQAKPKRGVKKIREVKDWPKWENDLDETGRIIEEEITKTQVRWRKWVTGIVAVFFVTAVVLGGFYLVKSLFSQGVEIEMKTELEAVEIGAPFKVEALLNNSSGNDLKAVRLALNLPLGIVLAQGDREQRVITRIVGEVPAGVIVKEEFELLALSNPQTVQILTAKGFYQSGSLGSEFEVKKELEVVFEDPVITIDLETPKKVFSGERFEVKLTYYNDSEQEVEKVKVVFDYPDLFSIIDTSEESDLLTKDEEKLTWEFEKLEAGEEGEITITGEVVGPANSFFDLKARIVNEVYGQEQIIDEKIAGLAIEASPLSLSVHVNDNSDFIAKPNDTLNYTLVYENNTNVGLKDLIVTAHLSGDMYDMGTVKSSGFFNSNKKQLSWNESTHSGLKLLSPGESGTVSFSVTLKDDYPISRLNDKNFKLMVEGQVESETVPDNVAADRTIGVADSIVKVGGEVEIEAVAKFRDANSGFVNTGTWPLKANEKTQFTVRWIIRNYSTDISNVEVKAFLGPGIKWTSNVKSTIASRPQYNERTQEVVWRVGDVIATKGVVGEPVEAVFQIEAVPSVTSIGSFITLLKKTSLTAKDDFVELELTANNGELTSQLKGDPTTSDNEGKVNK